MARSPLDAARGDPEACRSVRAGGPAAGLVNGRLRWPLCDLRPALAWAEQRSEREPAEGQQHEHVGEESTVAAVRSVRLGGVVPPLAAGKEVRFRQLMEAVNEQLNDEHRQEDRGDLE